MTVAVCFSGQCRDPRPYWSAMKTLVLDPLGEYDCFCHFWERGGLDLSDPSNRSMVEEIICPKEWVVEPQRRFDDIEGPMHHGAKSMFYSIMASNDIRRRYQEQTDQSYEWVVRIRTDIKFKQSYGNAWSLNSDKGLLYVRFLGKQVYHFNDQFAIASPDIMDIYAGCFRHISGMTARGGPEEHLSHYIHEIAGLQISPLNSGMFWW